MGFGPLFLGYLFIFSFSYRGFDILPDVIGFLIMYFGLRKLSEYGYGFNNLKKYMYFLFPASLITFVLQILSLIGHKNDLLTEIWNCVYIPLMLVFNLMLLVSIKNIATDLDLKVIRVRALRNLVVTVIYYVLTLFFSIPTSFISSLTNILIEKYAMGFVMYILGYVWLFLNTILIFSCYMYICKEGDEEMPVPEKKTKKIKEEENNGI